MRVGWRRHAACAGQAVGRFFPDDPNDYRHVVRLCDRCPVKRACLEEALLVPSNVDRYCVFGGLTPPQRRRLREQRATPVEIPLRWNNQSERYERVTP
jgi:hypothetical protein